MKKMTVIALLLLVAALCHAQWSTDPQVNNAICTLTGEQAIPLVGGCSDGGVYIAWFCNNTGNYNVRLQRLNADGEPQWAENGIVVSDNPQMTWLTDWSMVVDSQDNAILAFQDIRYHDNPDIFVYKITPDGSFAWGDDGVALTNDNNANMVPRLAVTDADNVIVCWSGEVAALVQKVTAAGSPVLATPLVLEDASCSHTHPQPMATAGDTFILKYFKDTGPAHAPTRHVYANRYDANVAPMWASEVALSTQGGISAWTQELPMINDGSDGLWTGWYDDRDHNSVSQNFAQHISADGTLSFADGGQLLSANAGGQNWMPTMCKSDDGVYAFWQATNPDQSVWAIEGQRLTTDGCQWGANGTAFMTLGPRVVNPAYAGMLNGDAVVIYRNDASVGTTDNTVKAMRVTTDGSLVWQDAFLDMSTVQSAKTHVYGTGPMGQQWVAAWEDERNGNRDIYAQNINFDGTLGPPVQGQGIAGTVTLDGGTASVTDVNIAVNGQDLHPAADGSYSVDLDPGTYIVSFSLSDYENIQIPEVVVEEGVYTTLDVQLVYSPAGVEGVVTLSGGSGAVTDVVVNVEGHTTSPAEDGSYTLYLYPGVYTVTFTLDGYETVQVIDVDVPAYTMTTVNATLEFLANGIEGMVTLDGGTGDVTQATVTVVAEVTNPAADGSYSLYLYPGTYTVVFALEGYESVTMHDVLVEENSYTTVNATLQPVQSVGDEPAEPVEYFTVGYIEGTGAASLRFSLGQPDHVRLELFNIRGQHVATLVDRPLSSGAHSVMWNARGQASGVYLARLRTPLQTRNTKLVLIK